MAFLFLPPARPSVPIVGGTDAFPVRRIFCVGRNYAEHAREMGGTAQADGLEPPFFFMKPGDALVAGVGQLLVSYPPLTANLHHEVEMVVALSGGGANLSSENALGAVFGYAVGLDLTRRDMQAKAKEKGHPWDMSKGFDQSAVCGPIAPASKVGHPVAGRISLMVNGQLRQQGDLAQMAWNVAEIVANLSTLVCLAPGDLIYSGTPAGVGAIERGDLLEGRIDGIGELSARIV